MKRVLMVLSVVLFVNVAGCTHTFIDISEDECRSDADCADGNICTVNICGVDRICVQIDRPDCVPPECTPTDEVCDGLDNDCDGESDEGLENMGPCGLPSEGECTDGHLMCSDGAIVCANAVLPVEEACPYDGLDNDCDGLTDEDVVTETRYRDEDGDGYGDPEFSGIVCHDAPPSSGVLVAGDCDDGDQRVHPGATEFCNGRDDDCNGEADESDPHAGEFCWGMLSCGEPDCIVPVPGWLECQNTFYGWSLECHLNCVSDEICDDGADNDCDTIVDDGCEPPFATIRVSLPGGTPTGYDFAEAYVYYAGGESYGPAPYTVELTMEQACGLEAGVEVKFLLDGWEGQWCRFWLMQVELNGEVVTLPTIHHDWTFGGNLQISRTMLGCPADTYPDRYADDTPIANLNFTLDTTVLTPEQVADTEIVVFYHDRFYLGKSGYPISDSFCRSVTVGGSSLDVSLPWYDVCQREYDSGLYDGRPGWQDLWNTVWVGVRSRSTGYYNPYGVLGALRAELNGADVPIAISAYDDGPAVLTPFEFDGSDPDCVAERPGLTTALRLRMARLLGSLCPAID